MCSIGYETMKKAEYQEQLAHLLELVGEFKAFDFRAMRKRLRESDDRPSGIDYLLSVVGQAEQLADIFEMYEEHKQP